MMNATLVNYQAQGTVPNEKTMRKANDAIHAAKAATPEHLRNLYRSSIRWNGNGYTWSWTLK